MTTNYVYIIQEREFIKTFEKIYKIGKSKQEKCETKYIIISNSL